MGRVIILDDIFTDTSQPDSVKEANENTVRDIIPALKNRLPEDAPKMGLIATELLFAEGNRKSEYAMGAIMFSLYIRDLHMWAEENNVELR